MFKVWVCKVTSEDQQARCTDIRSDYSDCGALCETCQRHFKVAQFGQCPSQVTIIDLVNLSDYYDGACSDFEP